MVRLLLSSVAQKFSHHRRVLNPIGLLQIFIALKSITTPVTLGFDERARHTHACRKSRAASTERMLRQVNEALGI